MLRRWGSGHFYMPHMISVDRSNNVWVTDPGRQQVLKFSASGELLMEMGQFDSPGTKRIHMCQPTHVRAGRDGGEGQLAGSCWGWRRLLGSCCMCGCL